MEVVYNSKIPIKSWVPKEEIEEGALDQAYDLAGLPFAFSHVALMPDAHLGFGMPIGGVFATQGVVIPNCVGVDIGCGVQSCKLPKSLLPKMYREDIEEICKRIKREIPTGFKHQKYGYGELFMPDLKDLKNDSVVWDEYNSARHQLGTLGGGNHFIELQKGDDDNYYIMVHSGSRNLGNKVAKYYHNVAVEKMTKYKIDVPKDLSYLPLDTPMGRKYLKEMQYCVQFAFMNRKLILNKVVGIIEEVCKIGNGNSFDVIDVPHNYAAMEHHFGTNVMVHRKGATKAYDGEIGLIPGSQGTPSFIVEGLGNPMSFKSCSHGAGRTMSRTKAKKTLSFAKELRKMGDIVHNMTSAGDLDEAPGSYKDIRQVMKNQEDLVRIKTELTPIGSVKA